MAETTASAETTALLKYLNSQRRHILGILEGLDDATLRRPLLPSGWTCLGLVQHLALDVERFWCSAIIAGEGADLEANDNAWQVGADVSAEAIFALYRQEIARSDVAIAATSPDAAPAWWPTGHFGDWQLHTNREIILHVITETAAHTGHLDIMRELIDGRQWLVLA